MTDSTYRKMVLINPEQASLYKPSVAEKKLSTLDHDINQILNSDLPDDEKAKRYTATLKTHRLLSMPSAKRIDAEAEILSSIEPVEEQTRARELLKMIKPYLSWNDDGEIVVNDRVVPFSNVTNLLSNLMSARSRKPEGWSELADILSTAKVPRQLIRNQKRWTELTKKNKSPSVSGSSSIKPPKKRKRERIETKLPKPELVWDEQS